MKTILFLLQKEFLQVLRNRTMLPVIFIVPIVQLIILVNAATLEMKVITTDIVDLDMSPLSRSLVSKFEGSPFFSIRKSTFSVADAETDLLENRTNMVLHIPAGFEQNLVNGDNPQVQVLIDAVNGMTASLTNAYARSVVLDFNKDYLEGKGSNMLINFIPKSLIIENSFRYNPELNFKYYMVPGILVLLVSIVGIFLTALNIVREKETGTIEQLNVTPIRKYQFITGKLLPFWIIALSELGFGLILGILLFRLPVVGSVLLLYLFAAIYLVVVLGFGLLISTMAHSQQQVMFLTFFFMITFILMSGVFTPEESMPLWAQRINVLNPFAYFMRVIRMILLKGSGFADVFKQFAAITVYAIVVLSLAIWRYRKVA